MKKLILSLFYRICLLLGGAGILDSIRYHYVVSSYSLFTADYQTSARIASIENIIYFTGFVYISLVLCSIVRVLHRIVKEAIIKK